MAASTAMSPPCAAFTEGKTLPAAATMADSPTQVWLRQAGERAHIFEGAVAQGFGRGGKLLGCPTANIPPEPYEKQLQEYPGGVYFGWAELLPCEAAPQGTVCKMVMSIGWNPYFKNEKKSIEAHLMEKFPADFYDVQLRVAVVGFIRTECSFDSLEALKSAIQNDVSVASAALELPEARAGRQTLSAPSPNRPTA